MAHRSALALALVFAACSGDKHASPPLSNSSGGRSSGGATSNAKGGAGGSATSGGSAGSSVEAGAGGDVGAGGEGGQASEPSPSVCASDRSWGGAERIAVSSFGNDELVGVSADELTIAWFADGALQYAERTSVTAAFGAALPITAPEGYFASAALSEDGLSIVGARKDGKTFGVLRRKDRAAAFDGSFDEMPFAAIAAAPGSFRASGPFSDPVLARGGLMLWFSSLDPESDEGPSIYQASRLGPKDVWPFGDPVTDELLFAKLGKFRRPSALSSDLRTLFYWDEVAGEARAAFRSFLSTPFDRFVSLDNRMHAVPNPECDRLYYSAPGTQGSDLFVEKRQ